MSRPGVEVSSSAASTGHAECPPTRVCTSVVGEAQQGPTDHPTRLTSQNDFDRVYGARVAGHRIIWHRSLFQHRAAVSLYFMRRVDGAPRPQVTPLRLARRQCHRHQPRRVGRRYELDVVDTPGGTTLKGKDTGPERSVPAHTTLTPQAAGDLYGTREGGGHHRVQCRNRMDTSRTCHVFLTRGARDLSKRHDPSTRLIAGGRCHSPVALTARCPRPSPMPLPDGAERLSRTLGPGQLSAPGALKRGLTTRRSSHTAPPLTGWRYLTGPAPMARSPS